MITVRKGDTHPIRWRIPRTDLSGANVSLVLIPRIRPNDPLPALPAEVEDGPNGIIIHNLDGTLKPGFYSVRIKITRNLEVRTAPSSGEEILLVQD